jgi:hypothetical protein
MRPARPLAPLALATALLLGGMAAPSAGRGDPIAEAADRAIHRLDLQRDIPHDPVEADSPSWDFKLPVGVQWVLAAGLAVVLIYVLRDAIPGLGRGRPDDWSYDGAGPGLGDGMRSASESLASADALAALGRFAEAMHVLLLYSLTEIRRRLRVEFADSLTSREIVRSARLPDAGKAALTGIVARVEAVYFGDHPADRADYESCRNGFVALQSVLETPLAA